MSQVFHQEIETSGSSNAILNAGSLEHAYDNNLTIDEPLVLTTKKPRHPKGDVKALYDFDMNWHFN